MQWISRLGPYCEARTRLGGPTRAWRHEARFGARVTPHRVLPETRLSLVTERRFTPDGRLLETRDWVYGPISTPHLYAPAPGTILEGVFIPPERAIAVLGMRADELTDVMAARTDFPRLAPEAPADNTSAGALANWAAQLLRATAGRVRITRLAERAGVSVRHLNRCMVNQLGRAPKALAMELRVMAAVQRADAFAAPDWADIAVAAGFSDQAHLSRAIKARTGLTPRALHAERRAESDLFKIAAPA